MQLLDNLKMNAIYIYNQVFIQILLRLSYGKAYSLSLCSWKGNIQDDFQSIISVSCYRHCLVERELRRKKRRRGSGRIRPRCHPCSSSRAGFVKGRRRQLAAALVGATLLPMISNSAGQMRPTWLGKTTEWVTSTLT